MAILDFQENPLKQFSLGRSSFSSETPSHEKFGIWGLQWKSGVSNEKYSNDDDFFLDSN